MKKIDIVNRIMDSYLTPVISSVAAVGLGIMDIQKMTESGEAAVCIQMQRGQDVRDTIFRGIFGTTGKGFLPPYKNTFLYDPTKEYNIKSMINVCEQEYRTTVSESCLAQSVRGDCEGMNSEFCNSVRENIGQCLFKDL